MSSRCGTEIVCVPKTLVPEDAGFVEHLKPQHLGVLCELKSHEYKPSKNANIRSYLKPVGHFATVLTEKGYNYGTHHIPHDGNKNDATLVTYKDRLVECGINAAKIRIVPRPPLVSVGVDQTRQKFPFCNFDKSKCGVGLTALERYENQYDEKKGAYVGYNHNWASHPSDAFRQFGQDYNSPVEYKPLPKGRKKHRA